MLTTAMQEEQHLFCISSLLAVLCFSISSSKAHYNTQIHYSEHVTEMTDLDAKLCSRFRCVLALLKMLCCVNLRF
jgi:hypothetical protein